MDHGAPGAGGPRSERTRAPKARGGGSPFACRGIPRKREGGPTTVPHPRLSFGIFGNPSALREIGFFSYLVTHVRLDNRPLGTYNQGHEQENPFGFRRPQEEL